MGPRTPPGRKIGRRLVERGLRPTERTRRNVDPAAVEAIHRDAEAGAFTIRAAQHRIGGHPHVLENHLRRRLGVPAHLLLMRAETQPRRVLFDDERRYSTGAVGSGTRHHHVDVRGSRPGDELFDPVEHIIATLLAGPGAQRAGIGARTRLGQTVTGDDIHRSQPRYPRLALLGGTERVDHPRAHIVNRQERRDRRAGHRQLLEDPHAVQAAQRTAAHIIAAVDRRHAQASRLAQLVGRKVMRRIPFQRVRGEPFGRERSRRLGDHPLVVVKGEELHRWATSSSG